VARLVNVAYPSYAEGRSEAVTSDRSQLLSRRSHFPNPEDRQILKNLISQKPLAPTVSDGDPRWTQVLRWVVDATLYAEELGITSENIDEQANNPNPEVKRFLGTEGNLGQEFIRE
jgi:general L-amino acid transport system substrate-binding protein